MLFRSDTTHTLAVDLTVSSGSLDTVSNAQADGLATLSWCDGEIVSYATANLIAAYKYNLTYLRRGQYGTINSTHLTGTKFMRLDDAIAKGNLASNWVGTNIYIKLLSFNLVGGGLQNLADVAATTYAVQGISLIAIVGAVPSTIPAGYYATLGAGAQQTISRRLIVFGRLVCFGRLIIN